uniref:Uncharacterized protein n=1 Tax=Anguilla anguilla TaxID=7936 RepID=A0A0E9VVJ3_ANGAN
MNTRKSFRKQSKKNIVWQFSPSVSS